MHSLKCLQLLKLLIIAVMFQFSNSSPHSSASLIQREQSEDSFETVATKFVGKMRAKRAIDHSIREYEVEISNMSTCLGSPPVEDGTEYKLWEEEPTLYTKLTNIATSFCKNKPVQEYYDQLQSTGEFADLDYTTDKNVMRTHALRLCALVSEEMSGQELSANLLASFKFLTCTAPPPPDTNWWQHSIGTPSSIWNPIFLAQQHLPRQQVVDFVQRWFNYGEEGSVWNPTQRDGKTAGANLGSRMFLAVIEAAIQGNLPQFVLEADHTLKTEIVDRNGYRKNGIRPDGCLHQHSKIWTISSTESKVLSQPYGNNYGKEFYRLVSRSMMLLHQTKSSFSDFIEKEMVDRFFDCNVYFYRGKIAEPSTTGRFIDSGNVITSVSSYHGILTTATFLSALDYRLSELKSAIRRYYTAVPAAEDALVANKFMFSSDIMVHHRQSFFATVRFTSQRTVRPESFPTQNALGYYQGDGWFSLLASTTEFDDEGAEIFQVFDWTKIPGVTCKQVDEILKVTFYDKNVLHFFNNGSIVGGVSNGTIGLAAFLLDRPTTEVKAKKSWFFFSDSVVALGSGIVKESNEVSSFETVATTINQVSAADSFTVGSLFGEKTVDFADGFTSTYVPLWLHHDGTGYVFPNPLNTITVKTDAKITSKGQDVKLFTAYIDHGTLEFTSASYSFIYLPAVTAAQTAQFSQCSPIRVVHQTSAAHAVCHSTDQASGIAMWQSTCVDMSLCLPNLQICSNAPILLMVTRALDPSCLDVSIADPRQTLVDVTLTVKISLTENPLEKTIPLPTGGLAGSSVSSTFCTT